MDTQNYKATGWLNLRNVQLTKDMINKLIPDVVALSYRVGALSGDNQGIGACVSAVASRANAVFVLEVGDVQCVTVTVHNRSPEPLKLMLHVEPYQHFGDGAKVGVNSTDMLWIGCLEQELPMVRKQASARTRVFLYY